MLIALRSTFIGLVGSLFAITITFSLLKPTGHASWTLWIVVVIGTLSLAYITRLRRRPLDSRSLETLATSYRILWLIGVGLAEAAALWVSSARSSEAITPPISLVLGSPSSDS